MIRAVFFDLYETLITEWDGDQRKAVYSTEPLGLDRKIYKAEWNRRRELRMNGTFPDHQSVLRDILSAQGRTVDSDLIESVHQERVRAKKVPFKEINPEIQELLQQLKERGLKVGLISNCAPEEVMAWSSCELANYFDEVVFSYEVKCAKPNPQIYKMGCELLEVIPQESIFIGDGGANELVGAAKAGMTAFHATWFLPDTISDRITEFPKLKKPLDLLTNKLAR